MGKINLKNMYKLSLAAISALIIIAVGVGLYLVLRPKLANNTPTPVVSVAPSGSLNVSPTNSLAENDGSAPVQEKTPAYIPAYIGEDFTLVAPQDWIQVTIPGALVAYQNAREVQPAGSAAEKIHFRSYLAVSSDSAQGKTVDENAQLVQQQTNAVVPGISFASTVSGTIDGQPARFMEATLTQQEVDFTVLLVVVQKGDKYFVISGNSTTQMWPQNKPLFYAAANSFKFK